MDVKEEIRRLTATADILRKFPELGSFEKVGDVHPASAFYTCYPSDRLEELLYFLHDNGADFTVEADESGQSVRIHVAGIQYWFSSTRIRDLDEKATEILIGGSLEDVPAVEEV